MTARHQVVWTKVGVTDRRDEDNPVEHVFARGQLLPEWVDSYTLFALSGAGAIKGVDADFPDPSLRPEAALPRSVLKPEHPPTLPNLPVGLAPAPTVVDHTGDDFSTTEGTAGFEAGEGQRSSTQPEGKAPVAGGQDLVLHQPGEGPDNEPSAGEGDRLFAESQRSAADTGNTPDAQAGAQEQPQASERNLPDRNLQGPERPSTNASKDEWVEYAVKRGTPRGEAGSLTKAELVRRFGAR